MDTMKATLLLKQNVDTLLRARRQKRKDLAQWCRRSEAWISKLMSDDSRNVPMKYFDRIADFFGIATYQLFQPGISPLTERRSRVDRRSGRDRRISQAVLSEKPGDVDLMHVIRALSRGGREKALHILADILNDELPRSRTTGASLAAPDRTVRTSGSTGKQNVK